MAEWYTESDFPVLVRLANLVDMAMCGEATGAVFAEIRQLEDRFGMNPLARRRLGWEVKSKDVEELADAATPSGVVNMKDWARRAQ